MVPGGTCKSRAQGTGGLRSVVAGWGPTLFLLERRDAQGGSKERRKSGGEGLHVFPPLAAGRRTSLRGVGSHHVFAAPPTPTALLAPVFFVPQM